MGGALQERTNSRLEGAGDGKAGRAEASVGGCPPKVEARADGAWPGAGAEGGGDVIQLSPCLTVPPQPDATLLPETVLLQHRPGHTVLIRPGQVIDRGTVLREHCASGRGAAAAAGSLTADEVDAAFELYRRRLLWQMVKRRWFNALTDFNVERLFTDRDPVFFVRFVGAASDAIAAALSACGDTADPRSVASLHASGAIKLLLKGGNNVNMIKYRALCCLPASVGEVLPSLAPSGLSDIDFLLMIDFVAAPWLSDASNFQVVHNACRTAVERAMTQLAEDTEAAVRSDEPTAANFKSLLELMATDDVSNHAGHQEASRTLSAELKERLNTALEALSRDVESAASSVGSTTDSGLTQGLAMQRQNPYGGVRNMLSQLLLGDQASVRPCTRRSLRICKSNAAKEVGADTETDRESCDDSGGVLRLHGPSVRLFVSNNQGVEHRDARCVLPSETCSFALVRAMIGYRVNSANFAQALAGIDDPTSVAGSPLVEDGEDQIDEGVLAETAWAEEAQISASATTLATDGATLSQYNLSANSRLLKGEGVDVSLPTRRDVNLQMWCQGEAAEPGSFVKQATLRGGSATDGSAVAQAEVPLLVESIDALILEQRDLTFGKRAQTLAIWRAAKVHKRLQRLVELCGIKCLTLPQYDWDAKRQAFAYIGALLEDFATNRLTNAAVSTSSAEDNDGEGSEQVARISSPKRRRKTDNSSLAGSNVPHNVLDDREQVKQLFGRARRTGSDASDASSDNSSGVTGADTLDRASPSAAESLCIAVSVCESAKFEEALILPLRHSALKAFSVSAVSAPAIPAGAEDGVGEALPADFALRWAETLAPLQKLVGDFERAMARLHRLHRVGRCTAYIGQERLYHYDLGSSWWSAAHPFTGNPDASTIDSSPDSKKDGMPLVLSSEVGDDESSTTPRRLGASDAQVAKTPISALLSTRYRRDNRRRKGSVSFAAGTKPSPRPRLPPSSVSPDSPESPRVLASPAPPASPDSSPTSSAVPPTASPDSSPEYVSGHGERISAAIGRSTSRAPSSHESDSEDDGSPKPSPKLRHLAMLRERRATHAGLRF